MGWSSPTGWNTDGWSRAVAAGGAAPTWTATGNPAGQNTGSNTATFSGVGIGSPAASDVIVAVFSSTSLVASSITCNGVAMTKQIEESSIISGLQIWSITASAASVTGSATTNFVASAGGNFNSQTIQVGKLTGVNPAPTGTGVQTVGASIAVTVPATGFAIVGAYGSSGATFSPLADFATPAVPTDELYMAHATATGTVSETGAGTIHFVYAAWGP